jgi:hypothetical protein
MRVCYNNSEVSYVLACVTSASLFTPENIMKIKELPPVEVLRELLDYNPESGVITWKVSPSKVVKAGSIAGRVHISGYRIICYKRKMYQASRIAYALHYGFDPHPDEIDHINRVRDDNRIDNLRLSNRSDNCKNRGEYCRRGAGVSYANREKRWIAYINKKGMHYCLGYFKTYEEARAARNEAETIMFPNVTTP